LLLQFFKRRVSSAIARDKNLQWEVVVVDESYVVGDGATARDFEELLFDRELIYFELEPVLI
jgi:hypothetical protein